MFPRLSVLIMGLQVFSVSQRDSFSFCPHILCKSKCFFVPGIMAEKPLMRSHAVILSFI